MKSILSILLTVAMVLIAAEIGKGQTWAPWKSSQSTYGKYTQVQSGDSIAQKVDQVDRFHSFAISDTLVMSSTGADTTCTGSAGDTVYHYFQGKFLYGFVCIDDSQKAASGALTDSIFVDRYDTSTATWRAYMVGFKNLYDNSVYGNPLIPGNNLQKMYLINEPYPMSYRVRYSAYWGNTQALVRKTIIKWNWKN